MFLIFSQGAVALEKHPDKGLLAGLWELPAAEGRLNEAGARAFLQERGILPEELVPGPDARHIFTHIQWNMTSWVVRTGKQAGNFVWATGEELRNEFYASLGLQSLRALVAQGGTVRKGGGTVFFLWENFRKSVGKQFPLKIRKFPRENIDLSYGLGYNT